MTHHFNGLNERDTELLAILAEECGEVVHAVGKILRHGLESSNPTLPLVDRVSNRNDLEREIAHLQVAAELVIQRFMSPSVVQKHKEQKGRNLKQWTHHQGWSL